MDWLYFAIAVSWLAFWVFWIIRAIQTGIGTTTQNRRQRFIFLIIVILIFDFLGRTSHLGGVAFHQPAIKVLGVLMFYGGAALAIWARQTMDDSWGMPMTLHAKPKLVSSGPFRLIRHPIYSGLMLMTLGSWLVLTWVWLVVTAATAVLWVSSARKEEKMLAKKLPKDYPAYKKRTKMFVPYIV